MRLKSPLKIQEISPCFIKILVLFRRLKLFIMKKFILLFGLLVTLSIQSQNILIYGGKNHKTFLGCLNCSKYDSNSIWNIYGDYGSKHSDTSIWNKYGDYGGDYSNTSPFNKYASDPPELVDKSGNFYGYLTADEYHSDRAEGKLALFVVSNWEIIINDVSKVADKIDF